MNKSYFEHDAEVMDIVSKITELMDGAKVEYNNCKVDISYTTENGFFEIEVLDYTDEQLDGLDNELTTMADSTVTITLYRNEQFVATFNNAFEHMWINTLKMTL